MSEWTPWHGGDNPPDDWDHGRVQLRSGTLGYGGYWQHRDDAPQSDIVAYKIATPDRTLSLWLRTLAKRIDAGEDYETLEPVVERVRTMLGEYHERHGYVTVPRLDAR